MTTNYRDGSNGKFSSNNILMTDRPRNANSIKTPNITIKKNKHYVQTSKKKESNLNMPNNYKIKAQKISTDKNTRTVLKIQRKDYPKNTSSGKNAHLVSNENSKGRNNDREKNFSSSLMNLTIGNSLGRDKYYYNHDPEKKTYVDIYNTNLSRKKKREKLRVASNDLYYNSYTLDDTNNFPESNINSSTNIENNKNYQRTNYSEQKRKKKIKVINNFSKKGVSKPKNKNNISCILINSGRHKNIASNDKLISKNLNANSIRKNYYKYNDSKNKNKYKSSIVGKKKIKVIKSANESFMKSNKYREKYVIKIQSNFRRYIFQKLLYNNINLYMRFAKAIYLLIKVCNFNKIFFMHQLKKKFRRNKIENNRSYNSEYNNNGLKMKMKRIIEENNELKKESIDSGRLTAISNVLGYNFFLDFYGDYKNAYQRQVHISSHTLEEYNKLLFENEHLKTKILDLEQMVGRLQKELASLKGEREGND